MLNSQKKKGSSNDPQVFKLPVNSNLTVPTKLKYINKEALKFFKKKPILLMENKISNESKINSLQDSGKKANNSFLEKKQAHILSQYVFNKFFICCKESRIESANSFYGCFYIGPFDESLSQTLAHNIRRTLLSQLPGLAITAVEIDGVLHKFSNLPGIKETVLDILCNLQNIVFKKSLNAAFTKPLAKNRVFEKREFISYLRVRGPGVVTASDIILPSGIECVNPNQYIATLAEDGILNVKLFINEGQNAIKQKQKNFDLAELKEQYLVNKFTQNISNQTDTSKKSNVKNVTDDRVKMSGKSSTELNSIDTLSDSSTFDTSFLLNNNRTNRIYLDSVFMPVKKVNTIVQTNDKCTDDLLENNLKYKFVPNTEESNHLTESTVLDQQKNQKFFEAAYTQTADFKTKFNLSHFNINNGKIETTFQSKFEKKQNVNSKTSEHSNNLETSQETYKTPTFFTMDNSTLEDDDFVMNLSELNNASLTLNKNPALKEQILVLTQKNKLVSETNSSLNIKKQCHIVVEIWTNGSIHPREALKNCLQFLANTFITLDNVKLLGSMFKSDMTYAKLLKKF